MSRKPRVKCQRLGSKLRQIREEYGWTKEEMISAIGMTKKLQTRLLDSFEKGVREPSRLIILQYARLANVSVESLVDDNLDLPHTLRGLGR